MHSILERCQQILLKEMAYKRHSWVKRKVIALHVWVCQINAVILSFRQPHIVAVFSYSSGSKLFLFFLRLAQKGEILPKK